MKDLKVIPFRQDLNDRLKKPWIIKPNCVNSITKEIINNEGETIWKGIMFNGKEYSGEGTIKKESSTNIFIFNGKLRNNYFDGEIKSQNINKNQNSKNNANNPLFETIKFQYEEGKEISQAVLLSDKKEYFVSFKKKKEIERKRTFEGMRLMIGKLFFYFYLKSLFFLN